MIEERTRAAQEIEKAQKQRQGKDGRPFMHVKIYSPFKTFFDEDAYVLSGVNATGPFDILPRHHNFMSLLGECELIVRPVITPPDEKRIRISGGLMHVKADRVTVFLNI